MSLKPQWLAISALLRGSAQNATILSWRATWGVTGGVTWGVPPQVSINFGIPNRCIEHKRFHTVLWLRQPRRFRDLVESIHTLYHTEGWLHSSYELRGKFVLMGRNNRRSVV